MFIWKFAAQQSMRCISMSEYPPPKKKKPLSIYNFTDHELWMDFEFHSKFYKKYISFFTRGHLCSCFLMCIPLT